MELRQLKYFVRIVDLGSLSRAAADLFVAQPALSRQIVLIENELKTKLLARSVRGVVPTEAGVIFYRHAQAVLRQLDRLRDDVAFASDHPGGLVSIGMPTSVANILAAPLIAAAQARYPLIQLQITESLSGHLEELIANGRIELSVLFERDQPAQHLHSRRLLREQLYLVRAAHADASADARTADSAPRKRRAGVHHDSPEPSVTLAVAALERFVLPGRANATRRLIERTFTEQHLNLRVFSELDSLSTITAVVASGLGATITALSAIAPDVDNGRLHINRIVEPEISRAVTLSTYDIVALSAAAQRIAELVPTIVAELVESGVWRGATLIDA